VAQGRRVQSTWPRHAARHLLAEQGTKSRYGEVVEAGRVVGLLCRLMARIGWGILGTGAIAALFAEGLRRVEGARLVAVGSRNGERAREFASAFSIPRGVGDYEGVLSDPEVDVVYVATPNEFHREHTIAALGARKAVLCEKPLALDAAEARAIIGAAREARMFCMEAMWMRFSPVFGIALEEVRSGAIGRPMAISAELGFPHAPDPASHLFAPRGGGCLLDLGVYPLSLVQAFLGKPSALRGVVVRGETGVDEHASAVLEHDGGAIASVSASLRSELRNSAVIQGTEGRLELDAPLYFPHRIRIVSTPPQAPLRRGRTGLRDRILAFPAARRAAEIRRRLRGRATTIWSPGNGYHLEAAEVMRCLRDGQLESPRMPLADSLAVLEVIDTIKAGAGSC
jgi:predicted dehydrogenase